MAFISVTEARTCRYDNQASFQEAQGLYTDGISTCNVIVIYKNNNGHIRMSMTHANKYTSEEQIRDEINWVGEENCSYLLVTKQAGLQTAIEIMPNLVSRFRNSIMVMPAAVFGISFDTTFHVSQHTRDTIPDLICHPQEWLLHSNYFINCGALEYGLWTGTLSHQKLLYKGENDAWENLLEHDISLVEPARIRKQQAMDREGGVPTYFGLHEILVETFNIPLGREIDSLGIAMGIVQQYHNNDHLQIFHSQLEKWLTLTNLPSGVRNTMSNIQNRVAENFRLAASFLPQPMNGESPYCAKLRGIYKICSRIQAHSGIVTQRNNFEQRVRPQ